MHPSCPHSPSLPSPSNDIDRRFLLGGLAGVASISALAAMAKGGAGGGPLTPPGGAVASTSKPLSDVEPRIPVNATTCPGDVTSVYIISQPGSYYLTGNLVGVTNKVGIRITATSASLDLMGFEITGGLVAVYFDACQDGAWIRNGTVRGPSGFGLSGASSNRSVIEDVRVVVTGGGGIAAGNNAVVRRCHVTTCGGIGISVDGGSLIESCTATANSSGGIFVSQSGLFGACVRGCIVYSNPASGIMVNAGSLVTGNLLRGNANGIRTLGAGNRIEDNVLTGNTSGIQCAGGNLIVRNSVSGSTTPFDLAVNNRYGPIVNISAAGGAAVTGSSAPSTLGPPDPHANFVY